MIKKNYSELFEFTSAQLDRLKKEYEPMRGKTISFANSRKLNAMMDRLSKDMLVKLANADVPFVSTSAASKLVMKHGMKFTDFKLNMSEADELQCEACWTGYKQVGFKKSSRTGKRVPNCVPESVVKEMFGEVNDLRGSFTDAQMERMKQEWKNKPASAMTQGVKQMIMNLDAPTRAALENAKINHISKFAGSTFEQKEEVDPSCKICEGEACECSQGEDFTEASKYLRYSDLLIQKGRMQSAGDKQGEKRTDIEIEKEKKKLGITDEFVPEADLKEFKKMVVTIADPMKRAKAMDDIKRFGKGTGFRIDKMSDGKSFRIDGKGADLNKFATDMKNFYGAKIKAESLEEADLSKSQVKMVHKKADDMPKKDFIKRYGKDGDSVRYATATNMVKKQLGIEEEEFVPEQKQKGDNMNEATYKDKFKAAMKDFGINSLDDLDSDADKKKFFKHVDAMHTAKNEELTPAQKKLPVGLQKAIKDKEDKKPKSNVAKINKMRGIMVDSKEEITNETKDMDKLDRADRAQARTRKARRAMQQDRIKQQQALTNPKNEIKEYGSMNAQYEMMKKEMMQKMEMMKAETDPEKMEMMKKEMMKEMEDMPEMMKKEMMKKMEMAMKEGFASDAQRKAAFASGYKEKGKKKKEEVSEMMKPQEMAVNAMAMNAMKMNAMKMPIRAMYKKEMKTGDDDMQPMSSMKMNAMTDPKKMNAMAMQDPKQDMAAGYMKSDVRAAVKDGGGKDMAKVKDKPEMMAAMKKINATYNREKYLPVKEGSIQDTVAQMKMTENREINLKGKELDKMVADYLKKGGVISKLPAAIAKGMKPSDMEPYKVKMKEVREFITTYNNHFLTDFKAEELLER